MDKYSFAIFQGRNKKRSFIYFGSLELEWLRKTMDKYFLLFSLKKGLKLGSYRGFVKVR